MTLRIILAAALTVIPVATAAQNGQSGPGISFRLGVGPASRPGYFGDEDRDVSVAFKFQLERLEFAGQSLGGQPGTGFGFGGSVRFIGERSADDFSELEGLDDVDAAFELGGGVKYTGAQYDVFANVRYGVIGHEAFVAEAGSNLYYRPTDAVTIKAGPRVLFGDEDYANTYFGVSGAEAAASSFEAYEASSGLISAGGLVEATYALSDDWELIGTIEYDQLRNDAADSPITVEDDQWGGSIVVTRRFAFGF